MATIVKLPIPADKIMDFCQRWHITELALFGSVLTEQFRDESDVDVLVDFAPENCHTLADLDTMEAELASIFGRPVDLIDKAAVQQSQNYIRRREILGTAQVIYRMA